MVSYEYWLKQIYFNSVHQELITRVMLILTENFFFIIKYDDDYSSKSEICDEDDFVPFSDDNGSDSDSEEESINPKLNSSISEGLVDGNVTLVMTRCYMYHGKDDTEWRSTPSAPNTQATVENVNTESSAELYSIPNAQGVRKNSDLFFFLKISSSS